MIIEILFLASQFQCGANADLASFKVFTNNGKEIRLGEKTKVMVESIEDLQFGYEVIADGDCALRGVPGISVSYGEELPTNQGVYQQPSLQTLIEQNVTDEYKSLVLFEVGTTNTESSAFDLQDLVLVVDTNPTIYAD